MISIDGINIAEIGLCDLRSRMSTSIIPHVQVEMMALCVMDENKCWIESYRVCAHVVMC